MRLDPDREPITRPVFVWIENAAQLAHRGEGSLAAAMQHAMDGRRLGDTARVPLATDERMRVNAVLQDWLRGYDPD